MKDQTQEESRPAAERPAVEEGPEQDVMAAVRALSFAWGFVGRFDPSIEGEVRDLLNTFWQYERGSLPGDARVEGEDGNSIPTPGSAPSTAARPLVQEDAGLTRVEVIDETGRAYVRWGVPVRTEIQDEGRTLKVFVRGPADPRDEDDDVREARNQLIQSLADAWGLPEHHVLRGPHATAAIDAFEAAIERRRGVAPQAGDTRAALLMMESSLRYALRHPERGFESVAKLTYGGVCTLLGRDPRPLVPDWPEPPAVQAGGGDEARELLELAFQFTDENLARVRWPRMDDPFVTREQAVTRIADFLARTPRQQAGGGLRAAALELAEQAEIITQCHCDEAYTSRGRHEPNAHCGYLDEEIAAVRALVATLHEVNE